MVALNKNVAIEDMCEHQTTLCEVKRGVFVKQEKISIFLPSKDNKRDEKRRGIKGKHWIDWPLAKWKVEAVLLLKDFCVVFFYSKNKVFYDALYSISAGNNLITHNWGSPKNIYDLIPIIFNKQSINSFWAMVFRGFSGKAGLSLILTTLRKWSRFETATWPTVYYKERGLFSVDKHPSKLLLLNSYQSCSLKFFLGAS